MDRVKNQRVKNHRAYSFGAILDAFWLGATFVAIWGAVVWLIGAALPFY